MKKGFTLVELLAVIVIISLVVLVAVPRLVKSIKNSNIDTYNNLISDIVLAANSYANNKDGILVQISVQTLQDEGYLPLNLSNPIDNTLLKGCVYVVDGTSIYKEEACSTYLKGIEPTRIIEINTCDYENGYEWDFTYTGSVESWSIPCTGLYKLEVWGAQGGGNGMYSRSSSGGTGAYAIGYTILDMDTPLYIVVGGAGGGSSYSSGGSGGYNGGGNGTSYSNNGNYDYGSSSGGGGATHISFENTLIKNTQNFENILIVAGGGGGANGYRSGTDDTSTGGLSTISSNGTRSGTNGATRAGAGGGGYYGGNQRYAGTNYIDGVPEITYKGITYTPSTQQGANGGNGKAKITLIAY